MGEMVTKINKRVLMVAYLFPPLGGMGAIRTLKFAQHLPPSGWEPYILTVKNGFSNVTWNISNTQSGCKVFRTSSFEFLKWTALLKRKLKKPKQVDGELPKTVTQTNLLIRYYKSFRETVERRLFIPDDKMFWIPSAVYRGLKIIKNYDIDLIYCSGGPFSSFFIGYALKRITNLPMVLDFRDPWIDNPYLEKKIRWVEGIERNLAKKITSVADLCLTVNPYCKDYICNSLPNIDEGKIFVVPNGIDYEDFKKPKNEEIKPYRKFTIIYIGTFHPPRMPDGFLCGLRNLIDDHPSFKSEIQFITYSGPWRDKSIELIKKLELDDNIRIKNYIPRKEIFKELFKIHLLLIIDNLSPNGKDGYNSPAKFFEYILTNKPILALAGQGALADLIKSTGTGQVVSPDSPEAIAEALHKFYKRYLRQDLYVKPNQSVLATYDRKSLTKTLAEYFDSCLNDKNIAKK